MGSLKLFVEKYTTNPDSCNFETIGKLTAGMEEAADALEQAAALELKQLKLLKQNQAAQDAARLKATKANSDAERKAAQDEVRRLAAEKRSVWQHIEAAG